MAGVRAADQSLPPSLAARLGEAARVGWLAIRLTWRASPWLLVGILLLLAFQAAVRAANLATVGLVVDRAALDLGLPSPSAGAADAAGLSLVAALPLPLWVLLAAATLVVGHLVRLTVLTFQAVAGDRVTGYVSRELIVAANRWQGIGRFEDPGLADDLQRARARGARSGLNILRVGGDGLLWLFNAVGAAVVLLTLHPLLPLLVVLPAIPHMILHWEYQSRLSRHLYRSTSESRRLHYLRDLTLSAESAKDVRLYALSGFLRRRYDEAFGAVIGPVEAVRRRWTVPMILAGALSASLPAGVYLYVAWLVARGERTLGELALYGGAASLLQRNVLDFVNVMGVVPDLLNFLPSLFRVLEAPPDLPLPARPQAVPRPLRQGITFEGVTFAYPGQERAVLRGVSCHLTPGECVALVGANGAGKTTLVKLLLRLYDPSAGRILLDGVDLRAYDLDALRRQMAVVFQDFVRFELTAGENVALGCLEVLGDRAALLGAAARAGALALLEGLPRGLDTPLGRELGGRDLSGGEWQKLALARTFLRVSPTPPGEVAPAELAPQGRVQAPRQPL
ncbi:MAG TPA: ABC transporter ATP-binding protein, partial [Chloroflexota bacterium]|nr:ABC transporter ATP-binding protein [Chloroflexota bacterium]